MVKSFKAFVREEIGGAVAAGGPPANNVSSGNIAGLGVGPQGEPGGPNQILGKKKKAWRRSAPVLEYKIFDVPAEKYHWVSYQKRTHPMLESYMGSDAIGENVKEYGRKHPTCAILLRNVETRESQYLRY